MSQDQTAITTEIADAVRSLNLALKKARAADIDVKVDYQTLEEIGQRLPLRVYYAEVSKQEFFQRVG